MIEPRRYLHRAPWVVPLTDDLPVVIADGAVLTEEARIVRVAPYAELRDSEATLVEHREKVLLPPLINCHTHLELSHLARLGQGEVGTGAMANWIRLLLAERALPVDPEEVRMAAWQALAQLYAGGCRAVLDIGNDPGSAGIGANFKVETRFFLEFFGLSAARAADQAATLAELPGSQAVAGHAPYSTHPELLKLLKERAGQNGQLLPVHLAESADELEFLATGHGPFRELLEERGGWDGSFDAPGLSSVNYLANLGLLDNLTLAVHCVQVDAHDIDLLARSGATVCLCPVSNRFLGVGRAPVPALLAAGVPLVLGSDSLASNPALDLWAEMRQLTEDHPGL
ncbi:MAG TPA: amidohydrolase family protein, partial [Desulfurivibrionaceae bacterium]|nr:amidohydrolase family protein [Desulfurivibrionaceae bacterium]